MASYYTLAGAVRPLEGSVVSPVPLRNRIEAAALAGFDGFGFGHEDLQSTLKASSHTEIRNMLGDNGLALCEIEVLQDWFCKGGRRAASDEVRRSMLRDAEALGARHIKVGGDLFGGDWPVDLLIEEFARLCDDAREAGTMVCIELFPASNFSTLEIGRTVVEGAKCSNGGLLLDIWHMTRAGTNFDDIARLNKSTIIHVELDDGPAQQTGPIIPETIDKRVHCGEGEFDIPGFLRSLAVAQYEGPFGVEILSDAQRSADTQTAAGTAHDHARAVLSGYPDFSS